MVFCFLFVVSLSELIRHCVSSGNFYNIQGENDHLNREVCACVSGGATMFTTSYTFVVSHRGPTIIVDVCDTQKDTEKQL